VNLLRKSALADCSLLIVFLENFKIAARICNSVVITSFPSSTIIYVKEWLHGRIMYKIATGGICQVFSLNFYWQQRDKFGNFEGLLDQTIGSFVLICNFFNRMV